MYDNSQKLLDRHTFEFKGTFHSCNREGARKNRPCQCGNPRSSQAYPGVSCPSRRPHLRHLGLIVSGSSPLLRADSRLGAARRSALGLRLVPRLARIIFLATMVGFTSAQFTCYGENLPQASRPKVTRLVRYGPVRQKTTFLHQDRHREIHSIHQDTFVSVTLANIGNHYPSLRYI